MHTIVATCNEQKLMLFSISLHTGTLASNSKDVNVQSKHSSTYSIHLVIYLWNFTGTKLFGTQLNIDGGEAGRNFSYINPIFFTNFTLMFFTYLYYTTVLLVSGRLLLGIAFIHRFLSVSSLGNRNMEALLSESYPDQHPNTKIHSTSSVLPILWLGLKAFCYILHKEKSIDTCAYSKWTVQLGYLAS